MNAKYLWRTEYQFLVKTGSILLTFPLASASNVASYGTGTDPVIIKKLDILLIAYFLH